MKLSAIVESLKLTCLTPTTLTAHDAEVTRGYASDLLSDVLANAPEGGVLVTIQVHMNVVAVAVHAGLSAVITAHGRKPDADVLDKAAAEGLVWLVSEDHAFDVVGRLFEQGVRGEAACSN